MTTTIQINDRIEAGQGDDRERGNVLAIEGDQITIGWDSGVQTTQSIEALEDIRMIRRG